jgi:glycosyltransferase involved in cell wall biosynthesis
LRLPIDLRRVCVLCFDDASTDRSSALLHEYEKRDRRFSVLREEVNRGTLYARIRLIEATTSEWLAFLDPDDELSGSGLPEALDLATKSDVDIVQFGCRMVYRARKRTVRCWREPSAITVLDRNHLTKYWLRGRVDVHLHRKIWRTEVFKRAVAAMPQHLRAMRILRMEDTLLSGYFLLHMTRKYQYIRTIGEIRHFGWPDNSQSATYQSWNETSRQCLFVANWTGRLFGAVVSIT